MNWLRLSFLFAVVAVGISFVEAEEEATADQHPLPSPKAFDAKRYMGKWFEVARLPTAIQPQGTLAMAEYALADKAGKVTVKNTAFDPEGKKLNEIQGTAELVEGESKGRLKVSFGPFVPETANYCVLKVDKQYRFAVVGSPDRKSLWVLSRQVPVKEKRLQRLISAGKKAGYDVSRVEIAKWPQKFSKAK